MVIILGTTQRKCPAWVGLAPAALTTTLARSWVGLQVHGCDILPSLPNMDPDCVPGGAGSHLQKAKDPGRVHMCARQDETLQG